MCRKHTSDQLRDVAGSGRAGHHRVAESVGNFCRVTTRLNRAVRPVTITLSHSRTTVAPVALTLTPYGLALPLRIYAQS
jgi:hypothetical protein